LLCFISICIFYKFKSDNIKILFLGDDIVYNKYIKDIDEYKIEKYLYDSVTYKEILSDIKSNSYKVIKNKSIYLNQLISSSDVIIFSANNFEYKNKCKKSNRIISDYDDSIKNDINNLTNVIDKISNSKIFIIGNSCSNKNHEQNLNLSNVYYVDAKKIENLSEFINKVVYN
jgi:hypothetical protein